jgi:chromosome segregation ATPase
MSKDTSVDTQTTQPSTATDNSADAQTTIEELTQAQWAAKLKEKDKIITGYEKKLQDVNSESKSRRASNKEKDTIINQLKQQLQEGITDEDVEKRIQAIKTDFTQKNQELVNLNEHLSSEVHKLKVDGKLIEAAAKYKAKTPAHVAALMKDRVVLNKKGEVEVLGNDGRKEYDGEHDMSIERAVELFLKLPENEYMVKSETKTGSGSSAGIPNTNVPGNNPLKMSQEQYNAFRRSAEGKAQFGDKGTSLTRT